MGNVERYALCAYLINAGSYPNPKLIPFNVLDKNRARVGVSLALVEIGEATLRVRIEKGTGSAPKITKGP